jgi:hypothetical protein
MEEFIFFSKNFSKIFVKNKKVIRFAAAFGAKFT